MNSGKIQEKDRVNNFVVGNLQETFNSVSDLKFNKKLKIM